MVELYLVLKKEGEAGAFWRGSVGGYEGDVFFRFDAEDEDDVEDGDDDDREKVEKDGRRAEIEVLSL